MTDYIETTKTMMKGGNRQEKNENCLAWINKLLELIILKTNLHLRALRKRFLIILITISTF